MNKLTTTGGRLIEKKSGAHLKHMKVLRKKIDQADNELIAALARRKKVVDKLARVKFENGFAVQQKGRWAALMKDRLERAEKKGLNPKMIKKIFQEIQFESIKQQHKLIRAFSQGKKRR